MSTLIFQSVPFDKVDITLALESGIENFIVPLEHVAEVEGLARCTVHSYDAVAAVAITEKSDENVAIELAASHHMVVLRHGWDIIPVENLLAASEVWQKSLR